MTFLYSAYELSFIPSDFSFKIPLLAKNVGSHFGSDYNEKFPNFFPKLAKRVTWLLTLGKGTTDLEFSIYLVFVPPPSQTNICAFRGACNFHTLVKNELPS